MELSLGRWSSLRASEYRMSLTGDISRQNTCRNRLCVSTLFPVVTERFGI